MASFRRTLSPANHDRSHHHNGSTSSPFSGIDSPSSKLLSSSRSSASPSSSFSGFLRGIRRCFSCDQKNGRRAPHSWRIAVYMFMLFWFLGFLLGMFQFRQVHDVRTHDFNFEIKPNVVHVQEEDGEKVDRPENSVGVDVGAGVGLEVSSVSLVETRFKERFDYVPRKFLIVVTPTYNRALQAYYLNRLGHVLRLVNPPLLWIVVEMHGQSAETADILRKSEVMYRHLGCFKKRTNKKDRGVHERNVALKHIQLHKLDGIVYFADDDNVYTLGLFERIREISRFGTWPVAMLAQSKRNTILEGPVCNGSQVIGWHTNEKSKRIRRFHVDMSGFAFNSTILWDPKRWRRPFVDPIRQLDTVKEGFQETTFIQQLVEDESQMEGIPHSCGRIMNWHLHLDALGADYPRSWLLQEKLDAILPLV